MHRPDSRLLAAVVLSLWLVPAVAGAQTQSSEPDPLTFLRSLERVDVAAVNAEAPRSAGRAGSRSKKVVLGAAIGGTAGLFIGEYWFGQGLDMPHGPDILLGAAVFGGAGAAIGWALSGVGSGSSPAPTKAIAFAPVLSKSKRAVMVRLSLK